MAKQTIQIGASANDGTGDPLRTAFDKCNDNFDELFGDERIAVLAKSAVAVSHTGNTSLTTLATISVPGGAMGPNGFLRVTCLWSWTNNANNKTCWAKFGGTNFYGRTETTGGFQRNQFTVQNRNSESSQLGPASGLSGGFGVITGSPVTAAIDTTASQNILLQVQLGNAADTATLEGYIVEICHGS